MANVLAKPPKLKPRSLSMLAISAGAFVGLLGWLEIKCNGYNRKPLALEGPEQSETQYLDVNSGYQPNLLPCTAEQADEYLRWEESSKPVQRGSSILRYDHVRVASCNPIEDELICAQGLEDDDEIKWIMTGIFDGHFGWETAKAVQGYLVHYVVRALQGDGRHLVDVLPEAADQAIKRAFLDLDHDIMGRAAKAVLGPVYLADAIAALGPAYSGSCALLSFYNSETRLLKIACTGDSRAVLGRRNASGKYDAFALSTPHTSDSPSEIARLQAAHPNEPALLQNTRLLGRLRPTRTFGDSRWKWPRELQDTATRRFYGPHPAEPLLTPPYLTAEPDITTTAMYPEHADFLIMASAGLWRHLTPAQAVDLVARWLDTHDPTREAPPRDLARAPSSSSPAEYPERVNPHPRRAYAMPGRAAAAVDAADPATFVVRDDNAATHLARNALGGGDEDKLTGMLTMLAPFAGCARDDITIQVIFFGPDPNTIEDLS